MKQLSSPVLQTRRVRHFVRSAAYLAACASVLVVAGCGGGEEGAATEAAALEPASGLADRQFALWAPGDENALRAEQRDLDPAAAASDVRLVVRLNPGAVFAGDRAALLAAPGTGESPDAAAQRASQLAAKVSAVATTAQAVLSRSVLQAAPTAVVRQQFSHAIEGFAISVPWDQAPAVAAQLAADPAVDGVELERAFRVGQVAAPVRTLDTRAWGVDRIDQRARQFDGSFRQALNGSGVRVYVVDTGVNAHNQFGNRLVAGFSSISDGRGTADCVGHGTHVAGTAAGATVGVAPGATVVPVRVFGCTGGSTSTQLLAGLDWVAAQGVRPAVVNLSLGGAASTTIDTAVQRLVTAGFSVVAAAGNDNRDACLQSPARAAGLVTVAASDQGDAKAGFSNHGSCVALWAPGVAIASAGRASASEVVTMQGTSMAAPHAAGAVALLLQGKPATAPAQVRQQMLARATAGTVSGASATTTRSLLYAGVDDAGAVAPPAVPVATPVSVRSIALTTLVPTLGSWQAVAAVQVVNDRGQPVSGARVTGRYSNMAAEVVCTTAASGLCSLTSAVASWSLQPVLGLALTAVQGTGLAYTGGGTRNAQVARPAAPVASVTALSGTMRRATPTAVAWTPQFVATVKDEGQAPVAGAAVLAVLKVHSGARVVGTQTLSCLTNTAGQCTLVWGGPTLNATHTGAALQVQNVTRDYLAYQPGAVTTASVGQVR
jgi:subtilisin family serine protease